LSDTLIVSFYLLTYLLIYLLTYPLTPFYTALSLADVLSDGDGDAYLVDEKEQLNDSEFRVVLDMTVDSRTTETVQHDRSQGTKRHAETFIHTFR